MPRLIVNADDFGYTPGVNRAILELFRAGVLTSTTLMATGPALDHALGFLQPKHARSTERTRDASVPAIGCHVVLVDGAAVSPAAEILSLVAPEGAGTSGAPRLRPRLGGFVSDLIRGRIRESDIEREATAQIRLLQARGIALTHVDTHKHTHMFPRVLRPLIRAALRCGIPAIRNPFEPQWSVAATPGAPWLRRAEVRFLARLKPTFQKLVAEAGLLTTAGAIGVLATGTLDARTLRLLLQAAARASRGNETENETWELVCHPGYHDAALAAQPTRLLAAREHEREALFAVLPEFKAFSLIGFDALGGRQ